MLSLNDSDLESQLSKLSREDQRKTIALLKRRMDTRDETKARQRLEAATRGQLSEDGVRRLVENYWPDAILDGWQTRLILAVLSGAGSEVSQVAIKGCTKAGKGYSVALAACLWFQLDRPTKIVVTSASHKHAHEVMFGEILRQMKRMDNRAETDIGVRRVWTSEEKYIVTASPESGEGFSGQHGPATLFIFDEASRGSEEYWDLAQTQAACSVALSNPRTMSGWFRRLYPSGAEDSEQVIDVPGSGKRVLFTVGGMDCINVRTGRKVITDQIDRARYDAIMAHPNATWRRVFGEGKFPEQDEELQVIAYSWLERHHRAHRPDIPVDAFALDVAASIDGDRSVLAAGSDGGCAWIREKQTADTMQVVAWVLRQALDAGIELTSGAVPVVVDMDGVGVGVGNRLAEQGVWVVEHRGNETSSVDSKTYANRRAETYGELGLRLNPKGPYPDEPWALPISTELDEDLTAPERVYSSDGIKWGLTPKDKPTPSYKGSTIRETLGRSPDVGDAVAMLYRSVRERRSKQGTAGRRSFAWCGQDDDETGEVELTPFLQLIVDAGKQENER